MKDMNTILNYYGFKNIEEAMHTHGFGRASEEKFLMDMYEEDTQEGTESKYELMLDMLYN